MESEIEIVIVPKKLKQTNKKSHPLCDGDVVWVLKRSMVQYINYGLFMVA